MNFRSVRVALILFCLLAFTYPSPAPLVYRPGEGWTYESPGETGNWQRTRAKDQLEVAQAAFDEGNYSLALKAARRTVRRWPVSDYAPQAQYLLGRCYEAKGQDERAFKAYQQVIEKYPRVDNYQEIVQRQFDIANRYLAGQWFKLWGYIPFFPSMDKTVDMYDKVLRNGPYSEIGAQAQMNIGAAREKQSNFPQAAQAYDRAADRYSDQREVAADARFKAGLAYQKQARRAEYDQSVAAQAIDSFIDFTELYPADPRVTDAREIISTLKAEQARGSFQIARFYEKRKRYQGALIYYNEVLLKDPDSALADDARNRIDLLQRRLAQR
jgi:outer membrane protein assembly factor BamD